MNKTSASRKASNRFSDEALALLQQGKSLQIRAGTVAHRFIGIWFVIVKERIFVRSWSVKPDGWYRAFLKDPRGTIRIKDGEIAVVALRVQSKNVRDAVDRAYLERYNTPGALKYAKDLVQPKSRATTMELVPLPSRSWPPALS